MWNQAVSFIYFSTNRKLSIGKLKTEMQPVLLDKQEFGYEEMSKANALWQIQPISIPFQGTKSNNSEYKKFFCRKLSFQSLKTQLEPVVSAKRDFDKLEKMLLMSFLAILAYRDSNLRNQVDPISFKWISKNRRLSMRCWWRNSLTISFHLFSIKIKFSKIPLEKYSFSFVTFLQRYRNISLESEVRVEKFDNSRKIPKSREILKKVF